MVVELGGALRSLEVEDRALVDGFAADEPMSGGRGQHCAPWPNRVRDGQWEWSGRSLQLEISEPARATAIHGLVRWQPWEVLEHTDSSVLMETRVFPQSGWLFTSRMQVRWELGAEGIDCTVSTTNLGTTPMPFGYAAHPYLTAGAGGVDEWSLELPSRSRVLVDERLLPTGVEDVSGTDYDFRGGRSLRGVELDTCFGNPDPAGRTRLTGAEGSGVELWADECFSWRQVYTGDDLPELDRRRQGVAVEPMSCPPDALRTGEDLVVLDPGASWEGSWGLRRV